ncbi:MULTISPECIES: TIGR03086 family metal-binding protein [Nocardiopsis]|uniref:TIGR03086 family metal-binding protein n=1 Tax=Nocardiopsis TaxID=2013 RepID=UPI00034C2985|nr:MULTISPECIES: TIGR03086 family metal-binding protein [Nocardiopsis]
MSDLLDLHGQAMKEFDRRVRAIGPVQWAEPTPCQEWDVHDLVEHLVREQLWVPYLLEGGTIAGAGDRFEGDAMGEEPVATWELAAREARTAWLRPGALEATVHLSFGDAPGSLYLWQMTFDLAVHAWDLARAIGADERLDPALVRALLESEQISGDLEAAQSRDGAGIFAPPQPVPEGAGDQAVLLARTGRAV